MDKKYQIFISSTYEDLIEERDQAIKAVLEMGHIPVGMEMFSAADEEQWKIIARQIEASDYYVVVVAHRYGSETPEGLSFTEKEYDYAVENDVPTLGFVIDGEAAWPTDRVDTSSKKKNKLDQFKKKVKKKLVQFWATKDDLHGKVSISLMKAINTNPRLGWTRSDKSVGPEVTKELTRLSQENAQLRTELEKVIKVQQESTDEVRQVIKIMASNTKRLRVRNTSSWDGAKIYDRTLLEVFLAAAPNLLDENSSIEVAKNIALSIVGTDYFKNWPLGSNIVSGLLADFVALDVVEPSRKRHSVHDDNKYWSLTKLGKQAIKRARRVQLEEGIAISDDHDEEGSAGES